MINFKVILVIFAINYNTTEIESVREIVIAPHETHKACVESLEVLGRQAYLGAMTSDLKYRGFTIVHLSQGCITPDLEA